MNSSDKVRSSIATHISSLNKAFTEYMTGGGCRYLEQMLRYADNIAYDTRCLMISSVPETFKEMVQDKAVECAVTEVSVRNGMLRVITPVTVSRRYSEKRYLAGIVKTALERYCSKTGIDLFLYVPPEAAIIMVKYVDGKGPESDPCNEDSVIINTICGELGISDNWKTAPAFLNMKIRCRENERPRTEFIFLPLDHLHAMAKELENRVSKNLPDGDRKITESQVRQCHGLKSPKDDE